MKRQNDKQLTKDDEDDDQEGPEQGTFARADEGTIQARRKVTARRRSAATDAPKAANPFQAVLLTPAAEPKEGAAAATETANETPASTPESATPSNAAATTSTEAAPAEAADKKQVDAPSPAAADPPTTTDPPAAAEPPASKPEVETAGTSAPATSVFGSASGLGSAGGFLSSSLGGGATGSGFGSITGTATGGGFGGFGSSAAAPPAAPADGTPAAGNGTAPGGAPPASIFPPVASVFGSAAPVQLFGPTAGGAGNGEKAPSLQLGSEKQETGEEAEDTLFTCAGKLFEFDGAQWRERAAGDMKVNAPADGGASRLVMRQKGNMRLALNAAIFDKMCIQLMEGSKTGVSFSCVNTARKAAAEEAPTDAAEKESSKQEVTLYAFRSKDAEKIKEFIQLVESKKPTPTA